MKRRRRRRDTEISEYWIPMMPVHIHSTSFSSFLFVFHSDNDVRYLQSTDKILQSKNAANNIKIIHQRESLIIYYYFSVCFFVHKLFFVGIKMLHIYSVSITCAMCAMCAPMKRINGNAKCPHMRLERRARVKSFIHSTSLREIIII